MNRNLFFLNLFLMLLTLFSCSKREAISNLEEALSSSSKGSAATVSAFTIATPDGFATGATGGAGGILVNVTTATDFKSAAESIAPQIITVSGNLDLGSVSVSINSNKTIVGADVNSGLTGNVTVSGKTNVIIQNLNFTNPQGIGTGDGLEISGSTNVFVTKCTFTDCKDGSLDVVRASDNVTVSWCRFRYVNQTTHNFCNLIGNGDLAFDDRGKLHVTMHHNWYDIGAQERQPRVRFGSVHCYNNYYGSNSDNYTVGVGTEAHVLLENNYFENQGYPWKNYSTSTEPTEIQWNSGNVFVNSPIPTWAVNSPTIFARPYTYSMLSGEDIKTSVISGAGNTDGSITSTAPAAPTGLTATAGDAQASLSWTSVSGAASYNIKRSTTTGGPYTAVASGVTASSYTNTGLTNGATYYYVVSAVNSVGESANSSQVSVTPQATQITPPLAPTGFTATAGNAQASLSWTSVSGATSYNVKRSTTSGGPYTTVATGVSTSSFTNTGLTNGTTYYYVVSAVNSGGESANSSQVSATPQDPLTALPPAPTGLTALSNNARADLTWTAVTGASSYIVKRSTVSGGPYTTIATVTQAKYNNTGLTNGTTYYYVVSAVNSIGEGANSSQVSATPKK